MAPALLNCSCAMLGWAAHESGGPQTPPQMLPGCIPPGRGRHRSEKGPPTACSATGFC